MNYFIRIISSLAISLLIFFNVHAKIKHKKATFAGGCFWCMEPPFEKLDGVKKVTAGYTGGHKENPTYDDVSNKITGHFEAVQIIYDSSRVTYKELLDIFWRSIDPTDAGGQFADRGPQYRTAVFYHDAEQKEIAQKSLDQLQGSGKYKKPIVTRIIKAEKFYPAEDYHQDYYRKEVGRYKSYRRHYGRDD